MPATRYASVLGLGFGDCGKGHFVDALTRLWNAHTIVRFNGGAQAGHNVVTPCDANTLSRHHTFSQFGSGSFVPGMRTVLIDPMIVHPAALLVEAEALARIGVTDALSRLTIGAQCRITTPFHQAAGRLRELLRGDSAHGSCGVGVGETVRHALEFPEHQIRYLDLDPGNAPSLLDKLQAVRATLLAEFSNQPSALNSEAGRAELQILSDETLAAKWMSITRALARQTPPTAADSINCQLTQPGCVLFEGAQGVLLDEWRGFHPHTTWSSINTAAVENVAARFGVATPMEHYGVVRTYLTRHGVGPFPTCDESLDQLLPEPHNSARGWQGRFRRGHPDAVLLRYALEAVGPLSGLLVSHLDVFQRGLSLKWCDCYSFAPSVPGAPDILDRLPLSTTKDLNHQLALTQLVQNAHPHYNHNPISSAPEFLDHLSDITSLPTSFQSYGPSHRDLRN